MPSLEEIIQRLTKHSVDCVEGALLLQAVEQLQQMNLRIQHLANEVQYLEREVARNQT